MPLRKPRDARRLLDVKARLHDERRQSDVVIGNASSRGLMCKCDLPPRKGARIEIHHGSLRITGHVIWSRHRRFGMQSDQAIDVGELVPQSVQQLSKGMTGRRQQAPPRVAIRSRKHGSGAASVRQSTSLRDAVVAIVVATATTSLIETGSLDLLSAWQLVSGYLPGNFG